MYKAKALLDAATPGFGVVPYNDDPGTTYDDIVSVYQRAIRLAERQPP
jgi:hypothetical protein